MEGVPLYIKTENELGNNVLSIHLESVFCIQIWWNEMNRGTIVIIEKHLLVIEEDIEKRNRRVLYQ